MEVTAAADSFVSTRAVFIASHSTEPSTPYSGRRGRIGVVGKKQRQKKTRSRPQAGKRTAGKPAAKYSAGEIAMAVLGAALLIMVAGIIITSLLG